jgi:hypothetical protein
MGLPYGSTPLAILLLNLPALCLILRRLPKPLLPSFPAWLVLLSLLLPSALLMTPVYNQMHRRFFAPHTYLYSDPTYLFARGDLVLEDPILAGVRLSYPIWPALAFQTIFSSLTNTPPASNWIWTNFVSLLVICGFIVGITKELGGGLIPQAVSTLWLTLGTNPIGYLLLVASATLARYRILGDPRYTPWITKFQLYSTMPLGMMLIAAMLYLLVKIRYPNRSELVTLGLLLTGACFLYPVLSPAACGIYCAKMLALLVEGRSNWRSAVRALIPMTLVLVIALGVCLAEIGFIQRANQGHSVMISQVTQFGRKGVTSIIATSLLLVGLIAVRRRCWERRQVALVLLGGALACAFLYSVLFIPYFDNEYKFVFELSMCLAPFAALATGQFIERMGRTGSVLFMLVLTVLLGTPFIHQEMKKAGRIPAARLPETAGFDLRLNSANPWSAICEAILRKTPANSVLAVDSTDVYFPQFTHRSLFVATKNNYPPGVSLGADSLTANVRGNGYQILAQRRLTLTELFDTGSSGRERALENLLSLRRPVAIVTEPRHEALLAWLKERAGATEVFQQNGFALWLLPAQTQ